MEQSDEQLITEYFQGNAKAMELIFHRHKKLVFNYALRILANRADAEDVTANVFFAILSKKYLFQSDVKFTTWLYVVIRNACLDQIRKRKRFVSWWMPKDNSDDYAEWNIADENAAAHHQAQAKETVGCVKRAIEKLPTEQREAIVLREYEQLSYQQISEVLNCSIENVKILIFRARQQLRQELTSFIEEGY